MPFSLFDSKMNKEKQDYGDIDIKKGGKSAFVGYIFLALLLLYSKLYNNNTKTGTLKMELYE